MIKEIITGIYLDVKTGRIFISEMINELETFYKKLNCDCITIVQRMIGGKEYAIVADDEGLLKPLNVISAFYKDGTPALVGSILIFNFDKEGELKNVEDIDNVYNHIKRIANASPVLILDGGDSK